MTTLLAAALVATNLPTVVVEASRVGRAPLEMAQHVEVFDAAAIQATDADHWYGVSFERTIPTLVKAF